MFREKVPQTIQTKWLVILLPLDRHRSGKGVHRRVTHVESMEIVPLISR
jgi:hypothetical protein